PAGADRPAHGTWPVHPHVRGACTDVQEAHLMLDGPSPRAWGLPRPVPAPYGLLRSIPTCVGPAARPGCPARVGPVHPHVRGACMPSAEQREVASGPSPRAWGLRQGVSAVRGGRRSIPTCVGPALRYLLKLWTL